MSESRKARRAAAREKALLAGGVPQSISQSPAGILGGLLGIQPTMVGDEGGGGWGLGGPVQIPASGRTPAVNPWMIPKGAGLNVISQTYPSNYYVEWTPSSWRRAGDRVMREGWTVDIATLYTWCIESSPFIQSLFRTIETAINSVPLFFTDMKGNVLPEWTAELCGKTWQMELKREIAFSFMHGFSGFNFDPVEEKLYVYPMQDIDPINRFLRQSSFAFYDGIFFNDHDNLLFVQPNTTTAGFLGWMFPITRQYIMMHLNDENWVQAGKRLAFPVFTIGYPETADVTDGNGITYNPYKEEAKIIAKDIGPGKTVIVPFTRDAKGEMQRNMEIAFEQSGASQKAHSIYQDFNEVKKNEIRELVMGGSLTADVGDSGSRALGEVQERKLRTFMSAIIEYVISVHNGEYKEKISKYYTNMPEGMFNINRQKQFTIEEIVAWSAILFQSGKKWSDKFFESNGIPPDFIEDLPAPEEGATKADPLNKKNDGKIQELRSMYANLRAGRSVWEY